MQVDCWSRHGDEENEFLRLGRRPEAVSTNPLTHHSQDHQREDHAEKELLRQRGNLC